jgi:diacylglycerol kinase family enzyme
MRRGWVILNSAAGSADSLDKIGARAAEALRARGLDPVLRILDPAELTLAIAEAEGPDGTLIVGGGDGTIRAAADHAARAGMILGILPMGTMNLFAKDLGVPLDPGAAADALAESTVARVDLGEVNERLFLHSAVLGIVPRVGEVRERARGRGGVATAWEVLGRISDVISREQPLRLVLEADGRRRRIHTFMLAISANRLSGKLVGALARESLEAGELGVYWATHTGRAGLLQLLAELGSGLWGLDDRIERHAAPHLTVHGPRRVRVSIDGEIESLASPLRFAIRAGALRILVPPEIAGA